MKIIPCIGLLAMFAGVEAVHAAAPTLSFDGRTLSLSAENQTFGQVMGLFQRQMGLEIEIPGDLSALRLPLVEVRNLSMREALLKVLEGSNYDYILVAAPEQPDRVRKLVVPGKSLPSRRQRACEPPPADTRHERPFSGKGATYTAA